MSLDQKEKKAPIRDLFLKAMKEPDTEADKLIARLQSCKEQWVTERDTHNSRIWRNSVLFYSGNHYVRDVYNTGNQYKVRLRENHLNNIMNRLLSVVVQNLPIVRVFPASDSSQDIQDAENTEAYGKYFWRTKKLEKQLSQFVKYALIFGNGFFYRCYNPDLGGKIVLDSDDGTGGGKDIAVYRGDIEVSIDDPFKIAVRPGIEHWKDMFDVVRSVPVSRSMLESKYGPIDADPATMFNSYTGESKIDEDMVVLNSYYHKPTPWFEEGMYVAWVGKKPLKIRPASGSERELPVVHLGFDKVPLKFWNISSIEQVIDLQEQLNRAASMIVEARNLMARPRVLASNEAKVPAQSLSDRPGEIIRFALAGGAPQFVVPPFNFNELANHKADVRNAISAVTGMTQASRGEVPTATRTALALQLVLEQDRSQYLPFIKDFHQSVLDVMQGIFEEAADKLDESDPRVIKIEGKDTMVRTFHGGMVPSPLDIWLEDTNPLGWTAGGRIETVQALAQMGVLRDPNQILEMLKINSPDPAFEIIDINKQSQQKENQLLERGIIVEISPVEDHQVHLNELVKVMASHEFKAKPQAIKDAYMDHYMKHVAAMSQPVPGMPVEPQMANTQGADLAPLSGISAPPLVGGNIEELLGSPRAG